MDRYDTRFIDSEEKDLATAIKGLSPKTMKRPSSKEQNQFRQSGEGHMLKKSPK